MCFFSRVCYSEKYPPPLHRDVTAASLEYSISAACRLKAPLLEIPRSASCTFGCSSPVPLTAQFCSCRGRLSCLLFWFSKVRPKALTRLKTYDYIFQWTVLVSYSSYYILKTCQRAPDHTLDISNFLRVSNISPSIP